MRAVLLLIHWTWVWQFYHFPLVLYFQWTQLTTIHQYYKLLDYSGDFIEKNWYHVAKTCSWIYWYTHETIGKNYLKWEGRQHKKQWTYTMQLCKMIVHIANDCIYIYIYTNVMLNAHWQRHCWLVSLLNLVY